MIPHTEEQLMRARISFPRIGRRMAKSDEGDIVVRLRFFRRRRERSFGADEIRFYRRRRSAENLSKNSVSSRVCGCHPDSCENERFVGRQKNAILIREIPESVRQQTHVTEGKKKPQPSWDQSKHAPLSASMPSDFLKT